MKKTLTINLSGIVFNIDEDAYDVLQQYLDAVEKHFSGTDGKEILSDIESRVAELLSEILRTSKTEVVTIENVESVISTLGHPEQFDEETVENEAGDSDDEKSENDSKRDFYEEKADKKKEKQERNKWRKFYRDVDNQLIGGVGSGIAAYLGCDVTIVRLLMVILIVISSGYAIPAYLLVWLIAPAANTTAQKLEMNGIEPSIENIKRYFESEQFKSSATRIGSRLAQICSWLLKAVAIMIGICIASFGVFVVTLILIALVGVLFGTGDLLLENFMPFFGPELNAGFFVAAVSALFVILIPIISIIMITIRLIRRKDASIKPHNSAMGWVWFVVWIVAVIIWIATVITNSTVINDSVGRNFYGSQFDYTEERLVGEPFNAINVSSGLKVKLKADTIPFVEVKGSERGLRSTKVSISDNTLTLTVNQSKSRIELPLVVVHYTDLLSIKTTSEANVSNHESDCIRTKMFDIDASSASRVNVAVECESLFISSSSAAKVDAEGSASKLIANSSSASKIDVEDLHAGYARAEASSGAKIELCADTINVSASSGSSIEYNGVPVVEFMNSSSGGNIKVGSIN